MLEPDDADDRLAGLVAAEHLRLALDAGALGTWRWDHTGGVGYLDERLEHIYGIEPGSYDGTAEAWLDIIHPDDRERVMEELERSIAAGRRFTLRYRVVWPDGTERWVEAWAEVVREGESVGTIGCARDITEQVVDEEARAAEMAHLERVAEAERLNRERLEFMLHINDALSSTSTVHQVMRAVTRAAVPRLGDWCLIHVLHHEGSTKAYVDAAHRDPRMLRIAEQTADRIAYDLTDSFGAAAVIRTGRREFFPRLDLSRIRGVSSAARELLASMGLRSSIVVPVQRRGRMYGAITFLMTFGSRSYTEEDLILAEAVAGRVAQALENIDLVARQVEIAEVLQASLLPASLPEIPGVQVAVRYTSGGEASEVGGDFYDVFDLHAGAWGVAIGDVCGQGPRAAAMTGLARHTIRASAWRGDPPETVLARLNEAVYRADNESFCTALYGVLDPTTRTFHGALGGHPLPIVVDPDGRATSVGSPGMLVGVFPVGRTSTVRVALPPGWTMLLYTDGVTDVPPPYELTPARWAEVVGAASRDAVDAEDLANRLTVTLDELRPARARRDDIALLVLRSV